MVQTSLEEAMMSARTLLVMLTVKDTKTHATLLQLLIHTDHTITTVAMEDVDHHAMEDIMAAVDLEAAVDTVVAVVSVAAVDMVAAEVAMEVADWEALEVGEASEAAEVATTDIMEVVDKVIAAITVDIDSKIFLLY